MGAASREIEIATGGRLVRTAVTVSSLGPRRSNPGFVVVIDDLTDLLRAQKASAWQEVAQRIAHEIKNPLTPIQLSAQRLLRYLDRAAMTKAGQRTHGLRETGGGMRRADRARSANAAIAGRGILAVRPLPCREAGADGLEFRRRKRGGTCFVGALTGSRCKSELADSLPPVKADPELMRRVMANLIDNAAEAMEGSTMRQLRVSRAWKATETRWKSKFPIPGTGFRPKTR